MAEAEEVAAEAEASLVRSEKAVAARRNPDSREHERASELC